MKTPRTGAAHPALLILKSLAARIDKLDFQLVAALRHEALASHTALAKAIDRTPSSVRRRMTALQEAGVLVRFIGRPAAAAIHLEGVAAIWDQSTNVQTVLGLEGTICAGTTITGGTLAGAYVKDACVWLEQMNALVGTEPATNHSLEPYNGPILSRMELKVLRALVQDPRGDAEALARLSGLSAKTVGNKRMTLLDHEAIHIGPMIRTGHTGAIVAHVHVTCTGAKRPHDLGHLADVAPDTDAGGQLCAYVHNDSITDQQRSLAAVRAMGGPVDLIHENEWVYKEEAVMEMVDAALAAWEPRQNP